VRDARERGAHLARGSRRGERRRGPCGGGGDGSRRLAVGPGRHRRVAGLRCGCLRADGWAACVGAARRVVRAHTRAAARQRNGTARGGARAARRAARCRRRAAFCASRLRSGGGCRLRAARPTRPAPSRSRRSGNRSGQDARLYRSGEPVGGEEPRVGMDLDIYPQPAEPDRRRARSALPRSRAEAAPRCRPQGA